MCQPECVKKDCKEYDEKYFNNCRKWLCVEMSNCKAVELKSDEKQTERS